MFNMIISWINLSLSILGPRPRSKWLFLEKHCHHSSALIYYPISTELHISIGYDNTANRFAFQRDSVKAKAAVTVFLEKHCHHSSAFSFRPILILYHKNV